MEVVRSRSSARIVMAQQHPRLTIAEASWLGQMYRLYNTIGVCKRVVLMDGKLFVRITWNEEETFLPLSAYFAEYDDIESNFLEDSVYEWTLRWLEKRGYLFSEIGCDGKKVWHFTAFGKQEAPSAPLFAS